MPGLAGLEILRILRNSRPTTPVIILSARGEENDRVEGLRLGADDYVGQAEIARARWREGFRPAETVRGAALSRD